MPRNENIDRLIKEKLENLYENPPDFIWNNIAKNTSYSQSGETINQEIDQAIKNKLNEIAKEPPSYVWGHIKYYLELNTIWQNIKRILLWQRVKRTIKTILSALFIFFLFEFPLNDYNDLKTLFPEAALAQREKHGTLDKPENKQYYAQTTNERATAKTDKNPIAQAALSSYLDGSPSSGLLNNMQTEIPISNDSTFTAGNVVDGVVNDSKQQMAYMPPIKPQLAKPDVPELKRLNFPSDAFQDEDPAPLWQVDIGTQLSVIISNYLFQSLFTNEYVTVNPGLITSFYVGRIVPSKNHIYRLGIVYGGFASRTSVLIDGRWHKETLESRYVGVSGSIGKLLLPTGYKRWIDGWLNTSIVYFTSQVYSSEIVRTNPTSNKVAILVSGELSYVRGLSNGDMFLIGGRINALPMNVFKQKGMGKFINLELHVGVRL